MIDFSFPTESQSAKTYVEVIASILKGQLVEVYIGDTYEQIQKTDSTENVNGIIIGTIIGGLHDCLVLNCFYTSSTSKGSGEIKDGNLVFLNGWGIKGICPIDGHGTFNDVFTDPKFFKKIPR